MNTFRSTELHKEKREQLIKSVTPLKIKASYLAELFPHC